MTEHTSEADLMRKIMLECTSANTRVFRNSVGSYRLGGRYIKYGLGGTGGSDLIAIREGIFCALEIKRPGQKATREQQLFLALIKRMGGLAGVAHSVEEAKEILNG